MNQPSFQTKLFINNEFVDSLDGSTFDVFNPYDNSLLAKVSEAKPADIDRAVAAFPDPAAIYEANMETLRRLGPEGWAALDVGAKP